MKKVFSLLMALVLCFGMLGTVRAEADTAQALLEAVSGTYDELFTVMCDPAYDSVWIDNCTAIVGEEQAPLFAEMLKAACTGELYGEEAAAAYAADPSSAQFKCSFIQGVAQFTFDGNTISGVDADGAEVFRHEYAPAGTFSLAGMMDGELYETTDTDAGEFRYFLLMPDTPETTYHIEFRYGSDLDALAAYADGPYAYWLAAGISADRTEETILNVIALFCEENLGELAEEAAASEAIEISTAEELAGIANNLSGHYVLTADIDLSGIDWSPIGSFIPVGTEGEEVETPDPAYAFTGTFEGNGHTISNLTVHAPEGYCVGLFGCVADSEIGNFKLVNPVVDGAMMTAAVVGYSNNSLVSGIVVENGKVTGHATEVSNEGMIGGVVGAAMGSLITNCEATANIVAPDGVGNVGIIGGGMEMTDLTNCKASGSILGGNSSYGFGGISGCAFGAEEVSGCTAENVTIAVGNDSFWIGGITGYAGGYGEDFGIPVTLVSNCTVRNFTITTGENVSGVDDIVGSGFYAEEAAAMGAPFDAPSQYEVVDCVVE